MLAIAMSHKETSENFVLFQDFPLRAKPSPKTAAPSHMCLGLSSASLQSHVAGAPERPHALINWNSDHPH